MTPHDLERVFDDLKVEATRLAGGLADLSQRATVYHHIYFQSGGNHTFPLIAAHGALWARGYFRFGMALGQLLSVQFALEPEQRRRQLICLHDFADVFRDVNRCVCVDTYANFHFSARFGEHSEASSFVPPQLLEALNRVHHARLRNRQLAPAEQRAVFEAHFLQEQEHVVGPRIEKAVAEFDWPLAKWISLRPIIHFAYFPTRRMLWFRNFANRNERIERGLQAFDIAAHVGWDEVTKSLARYAVLPTRFFADSAGYFAELRHAILAS